MSENTKNKFGLLGLMALTVSSGIGMTLFFFSSKISGVSFKKMLA